MSSTILTVIVLVVMWLVVLVPMFTRQRDDAAESTVERFGSAMRSLGRRSETESVDSVDSAEDAPEDELEEYEEEPEPVARPMPAARAQMLARRRRTLGTLVSLTLITVLLALGWRSTMWLANIVLDVLLVAYLWWLRQEARREQQRRARRAARGGSIAHTERPRRRPAAPPAAASPAAAAEPVEVGSDEEVDDGRWEPRPVPPPTYVSAPMAPRASYVQDEPLAGPVGLDEQDVAFSEDFDDEYPTMEIIPPRAVGE
ncbi:MAG TPA: hypothetical protein VHC49_26365 [Mycobacteriales bacterium]|nr:hypothetical protein [Mycobacteriales bacterium]